MRIDLMDIMAHANIQIKVRDPQMASKVIESVTTAGANQIQGSRFVVDKRNFTEKKLVMLLLKMPKNRLKI